MKNVGWLWVDNHNLEDYDPDFGCSFGTDPTGWEPVEAGNHPLEDLFFSAQPLVLNQKSAIVIKKIRQDVWAIVARGTRVESVYDWATVCADFFNSKSLCLLKANEGLVVSCAENPDLCLLIPWTVSTHIWPADELDVAIHNSPSPFESPRNVGVVMPSDELGVAIRNLQTRFRLAVAVEKPPDVGQMLDHFLSILRPTTSLAVRKRR